MCYIFVLPLLPIFFIFQKNIEYFPLKSLFTAIFTSLIISGIVYLLGIKVFKSKKILIFYIIFYITFFFFIPLGVLLKNAFWIFFEHFPFILKHKWCLYYLFFIFGTILLFFVIKKINNHYVIKIHYGLNIFSVFFLLLSFGQHLFLKKDNFLTKESKQPLTYKQQQDNQSTLPNIYHIVLDAYSSYYSLETVYGFKNDYFYNQLENIGFKASKKAFSSYTETLQSFCAIFSCNYLQSLSYDTSKMNGTLCNAYVLKVLKKNGYNTHHFPTSLPVFKSDFFDTNSIPKNNSWLFYYSIFSRSPLAGMFSKKFYEIHKQSILNIFVNLEEAKDKYGQNGNFFFAHILSPHEPYIFSEDGSINYNCSMQGFIGINQNSIDMTLLLSSMEQYLVQIRVINKLVLKTIMLILQQYPDNNKPIIIIHGDHGRSMAISPKKNWVSGNLSKQDKAAFGILFATYIPKKYLSGGSYNIEFQNLYRYIFNLLFKKNYTYLRQRFFMRLGNEFLEVKGSAIQEN